MYKCEDVDLTTEIFTSKFVNVLNLHAPWVVYQQRKNYLPWITNETKDLMASRDKCKKLAEEHVAIGDSQAATEAWKNFKQLRNKVNNRKKSEEINFKSKRLWTLGQHGFTS